MHRSLWFAVLAVVPFAVAAAPAPAPALPCDNLYTHEPLVVFEAQGTLPPGPGLEVTLTVHNDGRARVTKLDTLTGTATIRTTTVAAADVDALIHDLSAAGAGTSCDVPSLKAIPTFAFSTLTLLRDATDTKGHTFSWQNSGYLQSAIVDSRVWAFVAQQFPGL